MATPKPNTRHPLSQRPDESIEEWAKRSRAERGPLPEDMQNRIAGILRTSANHPANQPHDS